MEMDLSIFFSEVLFWLLVWKNGKLEAVGIYARETNDCLIQYQQKTIEIKAQKGKRYFLNAQLQLVP